MAKAWMGGALLALGSIVSSAAAQPSYLPSPGAQGSVADPLPCLDSSASSIPTPPMGSMGSSSSNWLPANLSNAWDCRPSCPEPPALYGSFGYMAMERQRLGHGAAALLDTASGGVETGNLPPAGAPEIADFYDVQPRFNHGVRATLGYHWGDQAIEMSGFYLSQNSSTKTVASPGSLDTFFNVGGDFFSAPLGFEPGLWLQADVMKLRLQTALGSAEVNYRCWLGANADLSWLFGIRYLDLYERFSFYTGDDDLTAPDPTTQAIYSVTAHNQIVAPQLGVEWNRAINCWLAFTWSVKGAWGANFLTVDTQLKRGDGFEGFHNGRSQTLFSHLYEMGFFLDFRLMDRARLRAGYDMMWVVDVAEALGQFDYDLSHTSGRTKNNETIFYGGPVVELHFLF